MTVVDTESRRAGRRVALVAVTICALPATVVAWAVINGLFGPAKVYPTGPYPLDVAVADVDGDDRLDVLTANRDGMSISVFLGRGDGGLEPREPVVLERGATSLAVADVNGDGIRDIVVSVCNPGCDDNAVLIFHGRGDGRFVPADAIPVGGVPYNVSLADLDGDGRLDIAASDYPGERLIVLRSGWNEVGFSEISLPTGAKPIALVLADLDDDGDVDLVSSDHGGGGSSVYLSHGNGEFSERIAVETGKLPYAIALAPLDADAIPELIVAHSTDPGRITVLQGRGDGTFVHRQAIAVAGSPIYVDTADFNGDGARDIVITRLKAQYAGVFLNEGDGFFDVREIRVPAEGRIYSLAVEDLNGDHLPDLIAVDYTLSTLSISLGREGAAVP